MSGKVYLVGAGPGDPGLITVRGASVLKRAEAVVIDALVNPILLQLNLGAAVFSVGKRGSGSPHGSVRYPQKAINALLIRLAKSGKRVVRLKGGDPFVFGRGSEEVEALRNAGVRFEIVPGVTSAVAAPAYAGIPITDRRWSSQVTFVAGHEGEDGFATTPGVDWNHLSPRGTLIVFMGVGRWPLVRQRLLKAGWPEGTRVAAIESGTTAAQRVIATTIGHSSRDFQIKKLKAPAIVVIGDVARLNKQFDWVKREKPLLGRRIVVTRPAEQGDSFSDLLQEMGADVIAAPALRIVPLPANAKTEYVVRQADWIVFLSANGVRAFAEAVKPYRTLIKKIAICALGPKTRAAVQAEGWTVKRMAADYNSNGVVSVLGNVRNKKILIPRVEGGPRDVLHGLKKRGAFVEELEVYRSVALRYPRGIKKLMLSGVDAVTFASTRTVDSFMTNFSDRETKALFGSALAASIGPMTTKALRRHKVGRILEARRGTIEDLSEGLCSAFMKR